MKWTREEYLDLMTFKPVERPMFVELFGPLIGLEEEWRAQGATEEELSLEAFDFDYLDRAFCSAHVGARTGLAEQIVEDTPEHTIKLDRYGRTVKLCKGAATIPLPLSHPVETMDDWRKIKHWYTFSEDRIDWDAIEEARKAQEAGALLIANIPGGYDEPRQLMGEEKACLCYYEDPELMHEILETIAVTVEEVLGRVCEKITIDQLSVHEDFAGKSGPLAGPAQIEEFIGPYYRRCWAPVKAAGGTIFEQDSDGNVNPVVDALLEAGLTSMYPMEPAAGMDIVALRERYGTRLSMRGGLDKHVLRQGREAIDRELEYKLQPEMVEPGGIVFGLDHRIPNGTPLTDYRYYVDSARERLGIPPRTPQREGWRRMA
jgi:uroporphyrinogen-III decarboxylase